MAKSGTEGGPPPTNSEGVSAAHADDVDYAHRHFVNLCAAAMLLVLALGVGWAIKLLDEQEEMRRCLGSGRKDCVTILAPPKGMIQAVR